VDSERRIVEHEAAVRMLFPARPAKQARSAVRVVIEQGYITGPSKNLARVSERSRLPTRAANASLTLPEAVPTLAPAARNVIDGAMQDASS
jgi:hypothetical protein